MISPLGQRQVLQTAAAESVRAATEVAAQVQREAIRKQVLDHKLAEDQEGIQRVTRGGVLGVTERQARQARGGAWQNPQEEGQGAQEDREPEAKDADYRLDFLA